MRRRFLAPMVIGASALAAQAPPSAAVVTVELSSFDYDPETIRLRADQPVTLRLVNRSSGGHNFAAPAFFAAARILPADAGAVRNGEVEVPARGAVSIRIQPARGQYRLRCTHRFHTTLGMRGRILVE